MILVVGGTGTLGAELLRQARGAGADVRATTRVPGDPWFLDLADPPGRWRIPPGADRALLCASAAGLAACEADPSGTRALNVHAAIALADRLAAEGAAVTFLSSTQVFAPDADAPDERTPPAPATEYGRQKLAVERHLLDRHPRAQIVRLTKVAAPSWPLLAQWRAALLAGNPVHAYADLHFSPIALSAAAAAILALAARAETGIFHLGAADAISYLDAARWLAARLGASPDLVHAASAPVPNAPGAARLRCERAARAIGFRPAPSLDNLAAAL